MTVCHDKMGSKGTEVRAGLPVKNFFRRRPQGLRRGWIEKWLVSSCVILRFIVVLECVCVCVLVCHMHVGTHRGQSRVSEPLELQSQVIVR